MQPIRRHTSIWDMPPQALGRLFTQAVGFAGLAYLALCAFGLAPDAIDIFGGLRHGETARAEDELPVRRAPAPVAEHEEDQAPQTRTIPARLEIPEIGLDVDVYVPAAVDVASLDAELAKGAVYYPGSGVLEGGNVFIFGHSTNWPVVRNQAFKTFNGLDKLVPGDRIYAYADGERHQYRVTSVRIAPDSEVIVRFDGGGRKLTLSTCNTFGLKEERVVVEAEYDGSLGDIDE